MVVWIRLAWLVSTATWVCVTSSPVRHNRDKTSKRPRRQNDGGCDFRKPADAPSRLKVGREKQRSCPRRNQRKSKKSSPGRAECLFLEKSEEAQISQPPLKFAMPLSPKCTAGVGLGTLYPSLLLYEEQLVKLDWRKRIETKQSSVTRQLENILEDHPYELSIRPSDGDSPTKVGMFLLIESITDISERNMDLTITLTMHKTWTDERLAFNLKTKNESVVLPSRLISKLWVPDIYIVGSKKSFVHRTTVENIIMRLFSNGDIYYIAKITTTIACQMNLKSFPLDTENCYLMFQSMGYNNDELMLEWVGGHHKEDLFMNVAMVTNMPKFTLVHHTFNSSNETVSDIPRFTGTKSRLEVRIELSRYLLSFFFQSYFPAMIIVVLAGLGMWIDAKSVPARVAMGVTCVLTISTIITGLKASLPKVSYLTAMDIYLWACFLFVFSTVVEYCMLNFSMGHKQEKTGRSHPGMLEKIKKMIEEKKYTHLKVSDEEAIIFLNNTFASQSTQRNSKNSPTNGYAIKDKKRNKIKPIYIKNIFDLCKCNPEVMDKRFRVIYIATFALFNIAYWAVFLYITQHDGGD